MTKKSKTIIGLSIVVVAIVAIIIYRHIVPPKIQFVSYDPDTHEGQFVFGVGRPANSFGNSSYFHQGPAGWQLNLKHQTNGATSFELFKNDVFVKKLFVK